ncbi:MAG: hypothetical protein ACK5Y2_13625 [Bdellovibrionales bacterium]
MLRSLFFFSLLSMSLSSTNTFAQSEAPKSDADALRKTQEVLRNQEERHKALNSPEAVNSAARVNELAGGDPEIEQGIWELAADLMPLLHEASGGDPDKMKQILNEARLNPNSFINRFPSSQRSRLSELASKLAEKEKKKKRP